MVPATREFFSSIGHKRGPRILIQINAKLQIVMSPDEEINRTMGWKIMVGNFVYISRSPFFVTFQLPPKRRTGHRKNRWRKEHM